MEAWVMFLIYSENSSSLCSWPSSLNISVSYFWSLKALQKTAKQRSNIKLKNFAIAQLRVRERSFSSQTGNPNHKESCRDRWTVCPWALDGNVSTRDSSSGNCGANSSGYSHERVNLFSSVMFAKGSSLCCILTGASRGLGAALAVDIAKKAVKSMNPITFILVARSTEGLEKTKTALNQIHSSAKVHCVSADLADVSTLPSSLKNIFEKVNPSDFNTALLINNASTLGDVSKRIQDFEDPKEMQDTLNVNVTSHFFLTSKFIKAFNGVKRYVVNISTLMALQEYSGFSMYCTAKAASEMAHRVMAKEEPDVRVLCYAPGPLDTELGDTIVTNTINTEVKNMLSKGNILQPEQSSAKLVNLLLEDRFKSGEHIDYFDC